MTIYLLFLILLSVITLHILVVMCCFHKLLCCYILSKNHPLLSYVIVDNFVCNGHIYSSHVQCPLSSVSPFLLVAHDTKQQWESQYHTKWPVLEESKHGHSLTLAFTMALLCGNTLALFKALAAQYLLHQL